MRVLLKKIICATDFSDLSNRAIPYGIALAKEFDAKLYICHVVGLPSTAVYGEILVDPEEQHEKSLNYAQEQFGKVNDLRSTDWEALVAAGHPADEISRLAREKSADLVIAATHGRSGLKRFLLGSVTERLMRVLPCPLFIVSDPKANLEDGLTPFSLKRILIGCDFSSDADLAFSHGLSLAQEFQSELFLVHVIERPVYQTSLETVSTQDTDIKQASRNHLIEKLNALLPKEALNWCTPNIILLEGQPDEELTRFAVDQNMDLIVLGVRGQRLVEKLFVGSTTDRVVRRAPCPVLSVCAKAQNEN